MIVITGATASGKTALSLQLAEHLQTDIISADSRQCYRELNIGVAKPPDEELKRVKHYFINSHSIRENITAQIFEQYALESVDKIFQKHKFAIIAGGTGLYIKAFCEGLDVIPQSDETVRQEIIHRYKLYGLPWLQQEVKKSDPVFWETAEQKNPQRLMRALEVFRSTGRSITVFRSHRKKERPFNIMKFALDIGKEQLHRNIDRRVDEMIANGLENEVKSLLPYKELNALQTVGYREMFDYLEGKCSLDEAIQKIKINTRQYAKRQLTWFKKDKKILWLNAAKLEFFRSYIGK